MNFATPPFTLRQLQYLVAVADLLSFSRAAARCRVSQPSLSAQIAQLEEALGARLFERDRRRVLPTAAGEALVSRARVLLREADDLVDVARRSADPLASTLRLGVIPTLAPYLVPSLRPALRHRFPKLRALWVEERTAVLIARLEAGELDGALLALESELGEVEQEVLGYDPFVLAARRGHPLVVGEGPVARSVLAEEDVLLLDDGHCFRDQALAVCASVRAQELEFRATSLGTLAQMVGDGVGVTLLPALAVATEVARADLAVRPFAEPTPGRTIALVWRKRSPLGPALRQLAVVARETPTGLLARA